MKRPAACLCVPAVAILTLFRPFPPAAPAAEQNAEIDAPAVRTAIQRGVDYLKRTQSANGTWDDYVNNPGGVTCLCTLALLTAGESPDSEHMKRALAQVRGVAPEKTYVVALQTMALCMAEPKKDLLIIRRNVEWLESAQTRTGPPDKVGGWSYTAERAGSADNSNTQFAMLALYEAERVGVPATKRAWQLALEYWLQQQHPDGSWGYFPAQSTGSMTCAGITSVYIASGRLSAGDAEVRGDQLICCGEHKEDKAVAAIQHGLAWLGNNFSVQFNPGHQTNWTMYYLYGTERVGRMTSNRFFYRRDGQRYDWYRMGAETLIARQDKLGTGFWKGDDHIEANPQISTSFALLFLAKGRRPILISKARFGNDDDWERHRSDLANLTGYIETKWKHDFPLGLSWQVIDVANASVEDLLQTPVLYISGSQAPELMSQARKLRDYIDRGGFILAEACCPTAAAFDSGFRSLMEKVFEEPEFRLKPVPPEHPIWNAEEPVRPALRPNLWSIDYGCRTSVVYCAPPEKGDLPHGLSCDWEIAAGRDRKLGQTLTEQMDAALSMGINILAYATNRELKSKDENFRLPDLAHDEDPVERGKRYVANIRHPGGCDAAPGALPNLLRNASNELKARFSSQQRQVALTDNALFDYDVVYIHGRHNFRFTDAERKQLRKYLERGTLLGDSICASRDFTAAFRREINSLFEDQGIKLEPIPADHPMFTAKFGGYDLAQVSRREPAAAGEGPLSAHTRKGPPELEGLKIGDRYAIIFSPYDLSCALEKHDTLECDGYTREDALRIGINLLLYATFEF
jgi:hypothetical protein